MKTFEQWYNSTKKADSIVEAAEDNVPVAKSSASIESDTATVVASPEKTGEEGYSKMMQDCDDIINSLKNLSDQLTESEDTLVKENAMKATLMSDPIIMGAVLGLGAIMGAFGLGVKAIKDTKKNKKVIKSAEKDYTKLKQLKLQTVKMEVAVSSLEDKKAEMSTAESVEEADAPAKAPNAAKKAAPTKDSKAAKKAAPTKDSKAAAKAAKQAASVEKKKAALDKMKAKLDNQISAMTKKKDGIKQATTDFETATEAKYAEVSGFGSNKVKILIADIKDATAQEIATYKLDAMGDTMSPETKKDLQERINKSKQSQKERMDKIKAEQEKNAKKLEDAAENDEKVKAELEEVKAEQEKNKKKETTPAETEVEDTDETPKPKKGEEEESDFDAFGTAVDDEEEPEEETEEVDKTDNSKEGMTKRVDAVIAKAEESGDEAKIKKAKDLKAKILAKESWQLNNTKLGLIFESDLRKMEMESLIQESISIKDRFSKLI